MFGKTKRVVNVLAGILSIQDSILDHLKVIKAELKESNLRLDDIQKNEYLKNQEKAQEECEHEIDYFSEDGSPVKRCLKCGFSEIVEPKDYYEGLSKNCLDKLKEMDSCE